MSCTSKTLTCSANGAVKGVIRFRPDDIEDAINAALEAKKELGLQIRRMECDAASIESSYSYYMIVLRKTETPEHFVCLAEKAKKMGWE